jgi:membrane protein
MKKWMFLRFYFQLWWRAPSSVCAAALTYTTTLSLVPALAVVFAALGLLVDFKTLNHDMKDFLYKNLATGTGSQVVTYLDTVMSKVRVRTLGVIGFGSFLVTSLMMISNVETSINRIWGIRYPKRFWRRFAVYNLFLIVGPVCAAVSISVSTIVLKFFPQMLFPANITSVLVTTIFVGTVYKMFPNRKVNWFWAIAAALFVAAALELAKWGYSIYTAKALSKNKIYGGLAVMPFFLVWIYVNWILFLSGALLHYLLEKRDYFRTVGSIAVMLLASKTAFAAPITWYVQKSNGTAIAYFSEEVEHREKGDQIAIQQKWKEQGKETLIGAVAKNNADFTPEAFYVEVKSPGRAFSIDGRMKDKALKIRVKHLAPAGQAEENTAVREEKGMIFSVYLSHFLAAAKAELGTPVFFNAIVEDTQDGSYEPKVGKALFLNEEKVGGVTCKRYGVTFQEIKSEWLVDSNGSACRVYFPKEKILIERSTEAVVKKMFGKS